MSELMTNEQMKRFLSATSKVDPICTWREAFTSAFLRILKEGEDVSTKRLWGDSSWQVDVAEALAIHLNPEIVKAWADDGDGPYADIINWDEYGNTIDELVCYLFLEPKQ